MNTCRWCEDPVKNFDKDNPFCDHLCRQLYEARKNTMNEKKELRHMGKDIFGHYLSKRKRMKNEEE